MYLLCAIHYFVYCHYGAFYSLHLEIKIISILARLSFEPSYFPISEMLPSPLFDVSFGSW